MAEEETAAAKTLAAPVPKPSDEGDGTETADASEAAPPPENAAVPKEVPKEESPAQEEPGSDDPLTKPQSRGKRWMKAVGRLLHITRSNGVDPQALRQP